MIMKSKSFLALIAKLLQLLNFLTMSNNQNLAKPSHRPFEQSLFLFKKCTFLNGNFVHISDFPPFSPIKIMVCL